jgi:formylglycine-generating enzyme required for sulfatase activity
MRRIWFVILVIGLSMSAFSQTIMFINKKNGTSDSLLFSDVKSITIRSGSSSTQTDLVQVAGGTFQMGSNDANDGASPPHSITLGAFYIDKTEITYEKWTEVRTWGLTHGYTDLVTGTNGYRGTTNNPVTTVNWYDVLKWCNARSEKDGLTPVYYTSNTLAIVYRTGQLDLAADAVKWTANGYRLPTEAEWEFAARGGTKSQGYAYSGSNAVDTVAWYSGNAGSSTHPVGKKGANELGLNDMSGNAWEWCWDLYGSYSASAQTDPKGSTSGSYRVTRGGSYDYKESFCRVAYRQNYWTPTDRVDRFGFRCVQD